MKVIYYILMLVIATTAITVGIFYRLMSSTVLYDNNFKLFHDKLDEIDRQGIYWTVGGLMSLLLGLLIATNLLWAIGIGVALRRARRRDLL